MRMILRKKKIKNYLLQIKVKFHKKISGITLNLNSENSLTHKKAFFIITYLILSVIESDSSNFWPSISTSKGISPEVKSSLKYPNQ